MSDSEITGKDYLHALDLHLDALSAWAWLDPNRASHRTPGGLMLPMDLVELERFFARRALRQRGWTLQQVSEYAADPERPRPLGSPKERRRFDIGEQEDPAQSVRNILHRLRATQPKPQDPSPERKRELTAELVRNIMPIGAEFRDRDAYEIAERASIRADEPAEGVRTEFLVSVPAEDPFAD